MTNLEKAKEITSKFKLITLYTPIANDWIYDAAMKMAEWKDNTIKELVHKMKEYLIVKQGFDYDSCAMEQFEDFIGVEHELYNPFETENERNKD